MEIILSRIKMENCFRIADIYDKRLMHKKTFDMSYGIAQTHT